MYNWGTWHGVWPSEMPKAISKVYLEITGYHCNCYTITKLLYCCCCCCYYYYYYYYYYFYVTAIFPGEPGSAGSPRVLLLHLFRKRTSGISGTGLFMGWMSFVQPNHQCQSTEGNTNHWSSPVAWPHPFFIHHWTLMEGALFPSYQLSDASTFWKSWANWGKLGKWH